MWLARIVIPNQPTIPCAQIALTAHAGVVELVDTPALGAGGRKALGVRVPSPALHELDWIRRLSRHHKAAMHPISRKSTPITLA